MEFHQTQLPSGLTVLVERNASAASMAAGFFVRTGARDEPPELLGVSHFLEHMVFKGTPRRSAWDINRQFDEIGADYNAETAKECTLYYASVLPEFAEAAIDLLCDILRPGLRPEDFDTEKKVILEEIAQYHDQPRSRLCDDLLSEFYAHHPLGNVILGTEQTIGSLTRGQMADYLLRQYAPGNIVAVATGNLEVERIVSAVAAGTSGWEARPPAVRLSPPQPEGRTSRLVVDPKVSREHIGVISHAPPAQDDHHWAAAIAATILGDVSGSRLYYALIEPAVADDAGVAYYPMDGAGAFLTCLSADNDNAAEALARTREELRRFQDAGPTDAELQGARNKIASGMTISGEMPMGRLAEVAFEWVYRDQYLPLARQIEALMSVTATDVLDVARQWDLTSHTMLALGQMTDLA